MGVADFLISFGKSRRGKITTFALVFMGFIAFLVGVIVTSTSTSETPATSISLSAQNMSYKTVWGNGINGSGSFTGYHLDVQKTQTHITVHPTPATSNTPATFSTNSPYISITNRVPSGGTAILTLNRVSSPTITGGFYEIHDTSEDIDKIQIDVTCGTQTTKIFVRVTLAPEDVRITATLEKNTYQDYWSETKYLDMKDFIDPATRSLTTWYADYRVLVTIKVFGETVYTSASNPGAFSAEEIYADEWGLSNVDLFHFTPADNTTPKYQSGGYLIYQQAGYFVHPPFFSIGEGELAFNFRIKCDFYGQEYFTDTNFKLIIKGWTI